MVSQHFLTFSGYRPTTSGQAKLFLPGHASVNSPEVEVLEGQGGKQVVRREALVREGHYWVAPTEVPLGSDYRFLVEGQPVLDWSEQRNIQTTSGNEPVKFNRVFPFEAPQKSGPILDVFSDSLLSEKQLESYRVKDHVLDQTSQRDHFNRYYGNEDGLRVLFDKIDTKSAFRGILFKPFIGGDNISPHKYWTVDPYVLNDTFSSKQALRDTLMEALKRDMKVYADGAFVNQGLNGVQMMSNLRHGFNSPYWDWFNFSEEENGSPLPNLFKEDKMTFGVLPVAEDPDTGRTDIDYSRFDIGVEKDAQGTYIRLKETQPEETRTQSKYSDSVQPYRFPIDPKELADKEEKLKKEKELKNQPKDEQTEINRKKAMLDWKHFQLNQPAMDNSSIKWDGQIDVPKMNMKNPEVRQYIQDAMVYWSRYVTNTYVEEVAVALRQAKGKDWPSRVQALEGHILPKPRMAFEKLGTSDIQNTLDHLKALSKEEEHVDEISVAERMMETMKAEFPLSALELPAEFKATLSFSEVHRDVYHQRGGVKKLLGVLLTPVVKLSKKFNILTHWATKLKKYLDSDTLSAQLTTQLAKMFEKKGAFTKLQDARIRGLMSEYLGQEIFLQLFTGLHSPEYYQLKGIEKTPDDYEKGFSETVPAYIRTADPVAASGLLSNFLKQQLKSLDVDALGQFLSNKLSRLDPESVAVAEAVLKKREFGLNWRIDAAKDIGDMDRVLNTEQSQRAPVFKEEIAFAKNFWKEVSQRIHSIFPKVSIIAELTDFLKYSGDGHQTKENAYQAFFNDNTFTSSPNMDYLFSSLCRLVNFEPRPDENGDRTIQPNAFYDYSVQKMTTEVPWSAAMNYQNMTTSHDYSTTAHRLLLNPELFNMDLLRWHGLVDDLNVAANELERKACFETQRQQLGINHLGKVLNDLLAMVQHEEVRAELSEEVQDYLTNENKEKLGNTEPTPRELKIRFIQELFEAVSEKTLGLSEKQAEQLRDVLIERISEPSENRAMRAVLNNAVESVSEDPAVKTIFYRAMNQAIQEKGQHFGYLPPNLALQDVVGIMAADSSSSSVQPFSKKFLAKLKTQLFDQLTGSFLEKYKRVVALQVALPGNPSIYLPDLLAQGGGEYTKNMFLQNRNLIRHDWLAGKKDIRESKDDILALLDLRTAYPALNDGFVLKPVVNDQDGVLPVIRDNGEQQVVMLVNTGLPSELDYNNKVGDGPLYREIQSTQPIKQNYKLNVSNLDIAEGTEYRDVEAGLNYVINNTGQLVSKQDPAKGIDVPVYKLLIRQ